MTTLWARLKGLLGAKVAPPQRDDALSDVRWVAAADSDNPFGVDLLLRPPLQQALAVLKQAFAAG